MNTKVNLKSLLFICLVEIIIILVAYFTNDNPGKWTIIGIAILGVLVSLFKLISIFKVRNENK